MKLVLTLEKYLESILKNPSLNSRLLGMEIESHNLILMANALRVQKQLDTLENLSLEFLRLKDKSDVESLFDVIFTLPQVSRFSVKVDMSWTDNSIEVIEALQQC